MECLDKLKGGDKEQIFIFTNIILALWQGQKQKKITGKDYQYHHEVAYQKE